MARPTLYNDILGARICKLVAAGVDELDAFLVEGLSRRTYFAWKAKAAQGEAPFEDFWEQLEQACARRNTNLQLVIVRAIHRGDVNAAFRALRAFRPDLYGDRAKVELTGRDGGPVETSNTLRYVVHVPEEEPEE